MFRHLRPVWRYLIFPLYLIKGQISGKQLLNINYMFRFSLQRVPKTFLILRRTQPDIITHSHVEYPLLLSDFN